MFDSRLPSVNHHSDVDQETGAEKVDFDVDPRYRPFIVSGYFLCCHCRPEMGHSLPLDEVPICVTVGQVSDA